MASAVNPAPPHADLRLARRLESLCATEMRRFAEAARALDPESGAEWLAVGGGVAAFVGAGSPVNQASGLGLSGPVGADEVEALERFYLDRGVRPALGVCPLADATLIRALSVRGWTVDGFENVLVRALTADEAHEPAAPGIEIREVLTEEDRDVWALVAATGFSDPLPPLAEQLRLAAVVVRRPGARLFLALVDGRAAGTGELLVQDGVAWLSADSTLPQFRGRGVQQSLQRHRLALGASAGCDLAATESAPGSISSRNQERAGFRLAYTRVDLVGPEPAASEEGTTE